MKLYAEIVLKRNLEFILFLAIAGLFVVISILNLKIILSDKKPLIITIDANGTRIVSEASDPIYKTEAVSFIQKFTFNIYNFNSDNFMKRLGQATGMMSDELWKAKRAEILSLKEKVERDEISISGELLKLTKDESEIYHALFNIKEKSRLLEKEHNIEVKLKLNIIPRSEENPYGLEVMSYEENVSK